MSQKLRFTSKTKENFSNVLSNPDIKSNKANLKNLDRIELIERIYDDLLDARHHR